MPEVGVRRYVVVAAAGVVAALGACGGEDGAGNGEVPSDSALEVDSCTLLTDEEVSAFAGMELSAGEDSPLGCGYVAPGETVADFSIRSYRGDGDAASAAATLAPSLQIITMNGIGDDAVALTDSDGSVNFLIARQGDLFVELVMTFLDVTMDSLALDHAGELASTALGRLVDAA